MKKNESTIFRAMLDNTGWSYLREKSNTLDGIKQIIDETYDEQIELGYTPDKKYTITCEEYCLYHDDDGSFVRREIIENIVDVYYPGAKTRR